MGQRLLRLTSGKIEKVYSLHASLSSKISWVDVVGLKSSNYTFKITTSWVCEFGETS